MDEETKKLLSGIIELYVWYELADDPADDSISKAEEFYAYGLPQFATLATEAQLLLNRYEGKEA